MIKTIYVSIKFLINKNIKNKNKEIDAFSEKKSHHAPGASLHIESSESHQRAVFRPCPEDLVDFVRHTDVQERQRLITTVPGQASLS